MAGQGLSEREWTFPEWGDSRGQSRLRLHLVPGEPKEQAGGEKRAEQGGCTSKLLAACMDACPRLSITVVR